MTVLAHFEGLHAVDTPGMEGSPNIPEGVLNQHLLSLLIRLMIGFFYSVVGCFVTTMSLQLAAC